MSLKNRASGPPEIASIRAETGAVKIQGDTASAADDPAEQAANLSKPPEPAPMALVNGTERTLDLPQAEEKTVAGESYAQIDNRPPAVPSAPAQAQTPAEPLSMAAPIESEKMKTDLVRPDGILLPRDATLLSNGTPPQANVNEAPLPAPQSPVAAKAPRAKAVAKPRKPTAARDPARHGQPRQIANEAKAMPVRPFNSEPAPIGDPKAVTPTTQPSPGTNGAFGFVQSAVNSLAGATAKLLEWGRIETGSRP
jgi:hypothetical protein